MGTETEEHRATLRHASDYATEYARRGWNPVPVYFKTKKPSGGEGWQMLVIREADVPKYFNGQRQNVGVLMGQTSGGLVDVDLDCPEAIAIAPFVLPRTGAIFGRPSARAAHWLYKSNLAVPENSVADEAQGEDNVGDEAQGEDNKSVLKFRDSILFRRSGTGKVVLVELRIGGHKGAQTVFPGSTHESGEIISWEESGDPAEVNGAELIKQVKLIAVGALFIRYWPARGARHDAALAVGGFMARAGYKPEWIKYFVERIAREAGCSDVPAKMKAAYDSATNTIAGKNTYGLKTIAELFGGHVADKAAEWLDYPGSTNDDASNASSSASAGSVGPIAPTNSEEFLALVFIDRHETELRFVAKWGQWFRWDNSRWALEETLHAFDMARRICREAANACNKASSAKTLASAKTVAAVERLAKADRKLAATFEQWDTNPGKITTSEED
jgi:hypothetical protein